MSQLYGETINDLWHVVINKSNASITERIEYVEQKHLQLLRQVILLSDSELRKFKMCVVRMLTH